MKLVESQTCVNNRGPADDSAERSDIQQLAQDSIAHSARADTMFTAEINELTKLLASSSKDAAESRERTS